MATPDEREASRLFDAPGQTLADAWADVVTAPDGTESTALTTAIRVSALLVLCGEVKPSRALDESEYTRAATRCGLTLREMRSRLAAAMCTMRVTEWKR